ncbi:tetratricopeptide repeat domain-containing protein [Cordyceps javanica]|uniref:Tetratricopeptide repeat domain-containing protein n=1 Tax=Cordyceps javanica TaxID=43265 RepID=A0A545VPF3_9HYPO|nr:tetratricopeptide repeat domain-containing protein [Cordyceps javanica]TQW03598.1 tetratricopeptide repeat domain containing protein [Cordyceps javanica]
MAGFGPMRVDCSGMFEIIPRFDARSLKPEDLRLLEILAFVGPGLPEEIVKALAIQILSTEGSYDEAAYTTARDALAAQPLIVFDGPKRKLGIIEDLQDQIIATLDDAKKKRFFQAVTRKIWSEWPAGLPPPSRTPVLPEPKTRSSRLLVSRWSDCKDLQHTVNRLEKLYSAIAHSLSDEETLLFGRLLLEGAWFQIERGLCTKSISCLMTAHGIAAGHKDADAFVADVCFCLGVFAMESNDFGPSRACKEQSFDVVSEICAALGGVEDERLSVAYAERGVSRIQDGRPEEGVADMAASIRIMEQLHSSGDGGGGGAYVPGAREANMAWGLLAQGLLDECDALLAKSLAARKALGDGAGDGESIATGLLLSAVAALRAEQGNMDDSFAHHQRAFDYLRGVVGVRDPCTARVAHKLAEHYLRMRRPEDARILINDALNAWSVDPIANRSEEARTTYLMSQAVATLGRAETAAKLRRKAITLYNAITHENKDMDTISAADFNSLVPFWSQ